MSKLLLGQSYYLRFDQKLWEAMQPYPPLGTLYAASYLRERGYEVALFDAMLASSEEEWAAALVATRPDFAIIYEDNFNYLSKMCLLRMRQAAFTMINMAQQDGCPIIVAGSDATDHAEQYLSQGADYVLLGEGEETLAELLDMLSGRTEQRPEDIRGLAYRTATGELRRNPLRPDIHDLDALPFPAWDLVDVARYRQIWRAQHGYYAINVVTTRGCPYHCNWCAKPIWGQRYHARSPESVVAELQWLKESINPDYIWFADDIMGIKPHWWSRFADLLAERNLHIPFKCLSRADLLLRREEEIAAIGRAGGDIVWIGAESGSQKVLDAMEKGITVEQIATAARKLHQAGIRVGFFLQFGYPGESRADIERTLQLVRDCEPDDIGMSVSYPLPGTKFYERVKIELGDKQNWRDSADLEMLYNGPFSTAFYRQLHLVLHKEFRRRKTIQAWRRCWRQRRWPTRPLLRETAASLYRWTTLPYARYRLNQLSKIPNARPLKAELPHMPFYEAAQPTPQHDHISQNTR